MRSDGEGDPSEALERNRVEHPSKPFIVSHESVLTYGDVARLAAGLPVFSGPPASGRATGCA